MESWTLLFGKLLSMVSTSRSIGVGGFSWGDSRGLSSEDGLCGALRVLKVKSLELLPV